MAGPRFEIRHGSYEAHLLRQQEFNRRAAVQREPPRDVGELLRTPQPVIYLPGPKAKTNAIGIPMIRAEGGE